MRVFQFFLVCLFVWQKTSRTNVNMSESESLGDLHSFLMKIVSSKGRDRVASGLSENFINFLSSGTVSTSSLHIIHIQHENVENCVSERIFSRMKMIFLLTEHVLVVTNVYETPETRFVCRKNTH